MSGCGVGNEAGLPSRRGLGRLLLFEEWDLEGLCGNDKLTGRAAWLSHDSLRALRITDIPWAGRTGV